MRTGVQKNVEIEFGGPDDFRQDSQCSLGRLPVAERKRDLAFARRTVTDVHLGFVHARG